MGKFVGDAPDLLDRPPDQILMVTSSVFLESRDACKAHGPASAPIREKLLMALAKIDYAALPDLQLVGLIF